MPKGKPTRLPSTCHPERPVHGRGLCNNCYQNWRYKNIPAVSQDKRDRQRRFRQEHPDEHAAAMRKWYAANRGKVIARERSRYSYNRSRETKLSRVYGLTVEEFDKLLAKQGGCAICGRQREAGFIGRHKQFAVDHDHRTNTTRGILCQRCNRALGLLNDDQTLLQKAINYLQRPAEVAMKRPTRKRRRRWVATGQVALISKTLILPTAN